MLGHKEEVTVYKPGSWFLTRNGIHCHLVLRLPAKTIKCISVESPILWYFVLAAWAKTYLLLLIYIHVNRQMILMSILACKDITRHLSSLSPIIKFLAPCLNAMEWDTKETTVNKPKLKSEKQQIPGLFWQIMFPSYTLSRMTGLPGVPSHAPLGANSRGHCLSLEKSNPL